MIYKTDNVLAAQHRILVVHGVAQHALAQPVRGVGTVSGEASFNRRRLPHRQTVLTRPFPAYLLPRAACNSLHLPVLRLGSNCEPLSARLPYQHLRIDYRLRYSLSWGLAYGSVRVFRCTGHVGQAWLFVYSQRAKENAEGVLRLRWLKPAPSFSAPCLGFSASFASTLLGFRGRCSTSPSPRLSRQANARVAPTRCVRGSRTRLCEWSPWNRWLRSASCRA